MSQDTTAHSSQAIGWDPEDPHGSNHGSHEHFVADWRMQVSILLALLFFTFLTVAFFRVEAWVEVAFGIHLPGWVNIAGAMSIATIKGVLVAAFFMQLKYDKVLNTFVLLFCLLCVGLFLSFSMIDLNSRDLVDAHKAGEIKVGGTGYGLDHPAIDDKFSARVSPRVATNGMALVYEARLKGNKNEHGLEHYRAEGNEIKFWEHFYDSHATHRDLLDEHDFYTQLGHAKHHEVSDANKSRPRTGLTPGLFSDVAPESHGEHGGEHGQDNEQAETESHNDGH